MLPSKENSPVPWKWALLAGLPYLLLIFWYLGVLLVYNFSVERSQPQLVNTFAFVFGGFTGLVVIGVLVLAWRRGWPRWIASWTVIGLLAVSALWTGLKSLVRWNLDDSLLTQWIFPLLVAVTLYLITRRDRIAGLLAAVPVALLPLTMLLEYVTEQGKGAVWLTCWLLAGAVAVLSVRLNRQKPVLWLGLAVLSLCALINVAVGVYLGGARPRDASASLPLAVIQTSALLIPAVLTLPLGPRLARLLRELGRRSRIYGGGAYRLALAGLLLALVALLSGSYAHMAGTFLSVLYRHLLPGLGLLLAVGLVMYTAGFWLVMRAARHTAPLDWPLMTVLFVTLPWVFYLVLLQLPHPESSLLPRGGAFLISAGLVWLAAALTLVLCLEDPLENLPPPSDYQPLP